MKKVEKVSIAEISFTLDSDAYLALKQYLDSLHVYYDKDPDGREIIADIEARIAELILDEQVYTKVVSRPLIDTIIAQLGTPEEIDDQAGEGVGEASGFSGAAGGVGGAGGFGASSSDSSIPRRLHRSNDGKIFGGVCSGLAKFLDISVAWVRLVFLLPVMLTVISAPVHWHWLKGFGEGWSWVFFVTYIVLWIALPMARTPRQKLEARGEKITPSSIRQTMQGAATTPAGRKAASVAAELFTVLGRVLLFFVKFVMAVVGFSLLFAAVGVFIGMFAILFNPAEGVNINGVGVISVLEGMSILSPVMFVELWLLCVLLPLVIVGVALLSFTFSWRLGRLFYGLTLGMWGLAMIACGIVAVGNARFFRDEVPDRVERWHEGDHWGWDYRHDRRHRHHRWDVRDETNDDDALVIDAADDSLVVVVRKDGTPGDTLVIDEKPALGSDAEGEAVDEVNGRKRVKIKRVEK